MVRTEADRYSRGTMGQTQKLAVWTSNHREANRMNSLQPHNNGPSDETSQSVRVDTELRPSLLPQASEPSGGSRRDSERFDVVSCAPLRIRSDSTDSDQWIVADLLDVSLSGFCLLLIGDHKLESGTEVTLDVSNHPDMGARDLKGSVCWCVADIFVCTIGVRLSEPLARLPKLAPAEDAPMELLAG
ncbi:PilZ domain-containing protein [Synechococcus sp. RSCCF101]|uniref:PilZ domain-containing protein n=1 Tax=Synechococcus sp. RSCCF101 TaxID=2511069 RepID=UPI001246EFC9|nr:PilZ domain-containing protein [Synechococcus sp. RSCCF101]QEY31254.1 PilZ domain-containing protein [Synechococcus sp. RSCCF101]